MKSFGHRFSLKTQIPLPRFGRAYFVKNKSHPGRELFSQKNLLSLLRLRKRRYFLRFAGSERARNPVQHGCHLSAVKRGNFRLGVTENRIRKIRKAFDKRAAQFTENFSR